MLGLARRLAIAVMGLGAGLVSLHCGGPQIDDLDVAGSTVKASQDDEDKTEEADEPVTATPTNTAGGDPFQTCTDECNEGAKRCSTSSTSATEICSKGAGGCTKWVAGADCPEDFSCDKAKNNGSCTAGCSSDPGCDATLIGTKRCSTAGTTELACTKSGACYNFKTSRTGIPQQCTTPAFCSYGARYVCQASANGACTQRVIVSSPCGTNQACQGAGQCVTTCTNDAGCSASTVNSEQCDYEGSRGKARCVKSGACYKWVVATACSSTEKCQGGTCVSSSASCTNACTLNASRCVTGASRSRQVCVNGSAGCTVWATGTSCAPDETCSNGTCL